jgi:S-DNA-T family DNA segregation ATPase FtsK/SpoIIIE
MVLAVAMVAAYRGGAGLLVWSTVAALVVALLGLAVWSSRWPASFDRYVSGPYRRWGWRRWARRCWTALAVERGLAAPLPVVYRSGRSRPVRQSSIPTLVQVATRGDTLILLVRTRAGQTRDELEAAVPAVATAADAVSYRVRAVSPSVVRIDLVMRDTLASPTAATLPVGELGRLDGVRLGRRQDGACWELALRGRHTLVVGCSGAGKGSVLWGVAAGLGPAIHADAVRLWGIDLKRGVELGMGQALFHATADTAATAMDVLAELLAVIDARGAAMVGRSRLHQPTPGDPLHVLVIDELAALTAYADADTRRDASRLLSEVLTQGRALGVVVVAMVQDPRKETVSMRGLFTQTVALRLRSAEETRMVLGDGMAALAPAHRISPAAPGTGYVVGDDGTVDLVRADWWSDELVRQAADTYPATVPTLAAPDGEPAPEVADVGALVAISDRPRKPRSPRASRRPAPVVLEDEVAP